MGATESTTETETGGAPVLEDLVVITGFSGAGKSTAMQVFEDAGYFCVDNLPPTMIRGLVDLFLHEGSKVKRAAIACDMRGGELFEGLSEVLDELQEVGLAHRVLFLTATDIALHTRYKETRRRHPLAPGSSVAHGIEAERRVLDPLREQADVVIDTTGLSVVDLRRKVARTLLEDVRRTRLSVTFESFGFKYGPARDADLLFDVRFLPNPHYEPELRPLTGKDPRVVAHVAQEGKLDAFYTRLEPLLDYVLPQYVAEGKAHLLVAIGCTGGRHRSVAVAEHLGARYGKADHDGDLSVEVAHRDIKRAG